MFSTRLNPTKPPAAHRAVLERVGAACRELRPIEEQCWTDGKPNGEFGRIFEKHSVRSFGVPAEQGGASADPLLIVMAAERVGREGLRVAQWFAVDIAHREILQRDGPVDQSSQRAGPVELQPVTGNDYLFAFGQPRTDSVDDAWFYERNAKMYLAGGAIGATADCLETIAARAANCFTRDSMPHDIERYLASVAIALEAARGLAYAAAELKTELNRRPASDHLRLETRTIIDEAFAAAAMAINRLFDQSRHHSVNGEALVEWLPARHRELARCTDSLEHEPRWQTLLKQIARYYVFE